MINKIAEIIKKVVGDAKFSISASEKPEFGHYATNAAFVAGGDPNKLAQEILRKAQDDYGDFFEKVEVKGKFINFWISKEALKSELMQILKASAKDGSASGGKSYKLKAKSLKINLEFISANPTGPLTIANGRGGFLGDVLANVLENVGMKVTTEYYINDAGNQIRLLGESILASLGKMPEKEDHYKGEYIKDPALAATLRGSSEDIGRVAAKKLLAQIKLSLKSVGIKFDVWFSEHQKLRKGSEIQKVLDLLKKKGVVEEKEGAVWLKTSDIADEKNRVLVKSDGQPTYFLSDLAYHYDKLVKRKFDKAIAIWGADHHGYVARLKAGVKALGIDPERLKIIITQLVRLVKAGQKVKISKRKGEFITLDELVKEVGQDAVRFFFLLHTPDSHMDFDLALAKERSMKNPVYYIQYAFVRAQSILRKSKLQNSNYKQISKFKYQTDSELNLIRELVKLPDVVLQTAEDYQVNRLARYAMELARAFHNFYEKERVLEAPENEREARLALVSATKIILERLFKIFGIAAPERM